MNAELQKLWNENKDFLRRKGIAHIADHNGYSRATCGYEEFIPQCQHPDDRVRQIWDAVQAIENL